MIKKIALYVPLFNSDGHPKAEVSQFQIWRVIDFNYLAPKFGLALEPTVLRLEGNYFIGLLGGWVVERLEKTGLRLNCSQTDFITDLPMV